MGFPGGGALVPGWGASYSPPCPAPRAVWQPGLSADGHCVQRVLGVAKVTSVERVMGMARVTGRAKVTGSARVVVRLGSCWGAGRPGAGGHGGKSSSESGGAIGHTGRGGPVNVPERGAVPGARAGAQRLPAPAASARPSGCREQGPEVQSGLGVDRACSLALGTLRGPSRPAAPSPSGAWRRAEARRAPDTPSAVLVALGGVVQSLHLPEGPPPPAAPAPRQAQGPEGRQPLRA